MKIAWLINVALPEVSELKKRAIIPFGSWLVNSAKNLSEVGELNIIYPEGNEKSYSYLKGKKINYYGFNSSKLSEERLSTVFEEILNEIKPDIVHIYGTEMFHAYIMVKICKKRGIKHVVSIQGLVSVISNHLYANLPPKVLKGKTLRNWLLNDSIYGMKKRFEKMGNYEKLIISEASNIIGRTTWDKICVKQINNRTNYFHCNEILRESFYEGKWKIEECEKHSIFVSQAHYPIKGFHFVLDAIRMVKNTYPNIKVYVSGRNVVYPQNFRDKLLNTYYSKFLKRKIKELDLENNVIFLGILNEREMYEQFLKSHIFVSASTIENESNSLSEAKILGVPIISSYVGGVIDRISHGKDGFLYQHDAYYILAEYICRILESEEVAKELSSTSRASSKELFDIKKNIGDLLDIYKIIMSSKA